MDKFYLKDISGTFPITCDRAEQSGNARYELYNVQNAGGLRSSQLTNQAAFSSDGKVFHNVAKIAIMPTQLTLNKNWTITFP